MDNNLPQIYGRTTAIINDGVSIYLSKGVSILFSAIDRLENYAIHESQNAYNAILTPEKWILRNENTFF
jgi:hypothetical protein